MIIWIFALPSAGKTKVAEHLVECLRRIGVATHHLDGDEVRARYEDALDFSESGRDENIRRAVELAREYRNAGKAVVASFITPYKHHRRRISESFAGEVLLAHLAVPLEECKRRDPKKNYQKALRGELPLFTGVGDRFDEPVSDELNVFSFKNTDRSAEETSQEIMAKLISSGLLPDQT